jgi:hypothetical protein
LSEVNDGHNEVSKAQGPKVQNLLHKHWWAMMKIITSPIEGGEQARDACDALLGVEWERPVLRVLEMHL